MQDTHAWIVTPDAESGRSGSARIPRSCHGSPRKMKPLQSFSVFTLTSVALVMTLSLGSVTGQAVAPTREPSYLPHCDAELGMHSGSIPDSAITASSSYDEKSVGPLNSRIRQERSGGAWCPKQQISKDVYEYLQIDLGQIKMITAVETQGRFGNGQGQEWAPHYLIEYQREDDTTWVRYKDKKDKEIIKGNTNTYTPLVQRIRPPIIARRIRFIPYSFYPRTICMRVEAYGCPWTDGVMSYNTWQGERRGAEVDLYDLTYDGKIVENHLTGGLGQLTDIEVGESNFRLDRDATGKKGYEWVGWKNDTLASRPIEINFRFDVVRNFTAVRLHCNNYFTKDVRVFRRALVYFSIGGRYYQTEPVEYEYLRDTLIDYARYVMIPISNKIGKFVKIELYFDARWILLSEVQFESAPATGNQTEEAIPPSTPSPPSTTTPVRSIPRGPQSVEVHILPGGSRESGRSDDGTMSPENPLDTHPHPHRQRGDTYIGIVIGALAALIVLVVVVVVVVYLRHRRNKYNNSSPLKNPMLGVDHVNFNLNDLTPGLSSGKLLNGNMYNSVSTTDAETEKEPLQPAVSSDVYREPCDSIQCRRLPELPAHLSLSKQNNAVCREYASTDVTKKFSANPPAYPANVGREETPPPPPPPLPHPRALGAALDTVNIQGITGNSLYACPNNDLFWKEDLDVIEFPRNSLQFVEKLGEGQFGEVHLCEAGTDFLGDDFLVNRTASRSMLVAIKMLRREACDQARGDFHKEVKIMSRLKDPNIVRVMGVCTQDEPLCVIVEYMKFGDLNQFLQQHLPLESTMPRANNQPVLSYGCLIYMATQIASGMKYLETLNMVHRDLASRNCLVGSYYTIKISDFGMSRSLYSSDYYRIEGKAILPIRWMAWESVLLGKFSCKSDVWSFAVSLWEVLTFCREQPFGEVPDEQVIENCGHYYRNDSQELCLPQPHNCPKEIFDLMRECWNRDEAQRPTFREIHMFLQRKNMGYDPREEEPGMTGMSLTPVV